MFNPITYLRAVIHRNPSSSELERLLGQGSQSIEGIAINDQSVMGIAAVKCAVDIISSDIASMPLNVFQKVDDDSRVKAKNHSLYPVLKYNVMQNVSSYRWKQTAMVHLLLRGNCYSQKIRNGYGDVVGLNLLHPDRVSLRIDNTTGEISYGILTQGKEMVILPEKDVLHIRGMSLDGLMGLSVLDCARESFSVTIAGERVQAKSFENISIPQGLITVPPGLLKTEEDVNLFRKMWDDIHKGIQNTGKPGVLRDGMSFAQVKMSNVDLQLLELRKIGIDDVSRWFKIPPSKINVNFYGTSSYNNSEMMNRQYYESTLRPWIELIEAELELQLLKPNEREIYYIEFNVDELLRADSQTRYQNYQIAFQNGILNRDEIRALENLPSVPNGKQFFVPLNFQTIENAINPPEPSTDFPPSDPVNDKPSEEKPEEDPEDEKQRTYEIRAKALTERLQLRKQFKPLLEDAMTRIIKREVSELTKIAEKHLNKRDIPSFEQMMKNFYFENYVYDIDVNRPVNVNGKIDGYMLKTMSPAYSLYAEKIVEGAARETGGVLAVDVPTFTQSYIKNYIDRHKRESYDKVYKLVHNNQEVKLEDLKSEFDKWLTDRGAIITNGHITKLDNKIAHEQYKKSGVQYIKWVTHGENCPLCNQLNGKVIDIKTNFVNEGETLTAEGVSNYTASHHINAGNLHTGCDCSIAIA